MALVKKASHGPPPHFGTCSNLGGGSPPPLFWNSVNIVRSIIQVVSRVKDHHMSQVIYANILLGLTSEVTNHYRVYVPKWFIRTSRPQCLTKTKSSPSQGHVGCLCVPKALAACN